MRVGGRERLKEILQIREIAERQMRDKQDAVRLFKQVCGNELLGHEDAMSSGETGLSGLFRERGGRLPGKLQAVQIRVYAFLREQFGVVADLGNPAVREDHDAVGPFDRR